MSYVQSVIDYLVQEYELPNYKAEALADKYKEEIQRAEAVGSFPYYPADRIIEKER